MAKPNLTDRQELINSIEIFRGCISEQEANGNTARRDRMIIEIQADISKWQQKIVEIRGRHDEAPARLLKLDKGLKKAKKALLHHDKRHQIERLRKLAVQCDDA